MSAPQPVPARARTLLLRAIEKAEAGAHRDASSLATEGEAAAEDSVSAVSASAQIRFAIGDEDGAFAALERAMARGPSAAGLALSWKAIFLRRRGRLAAALAVLDEVAAIDGHAASAHGYAASIHTTARDDAGALVHLRRALAHGAPLDLELGAVLTRLGRTDEGCRAVRAFVEQGPRSAARRLAAGIQLLEAGAFDDAEACLEIAAADAVTQVSAWAQLARLQLWRGDTENASTLCARALAVEPEHALALAVRGGVHVLRAEHADALEVLDSALASDTALHEAFVWRAEARFALGDHALALEDLERASSTIGDYFVAHLLRLVFGLHAAAPTSRLSFAAYEPVLAGVSALLPEGPEALATGDPAVILPVLARVLRMLAGNRSPFVTAVEDEGARRVRRVHIPATARFAAKWTLEQIQILPLGEVLRRFDGVLEAHPRSSKPHCYRGELRLWMGDLEEARGDFEIALSRDPATRWAYIGLAATQLLAGRHDDALVTCARGAARAGQGPTVLVYRGEAHRRRGDLESAAADLGRACAMHPSRIGAWLNLALVHGARGDHAARDATMARLAWQATPLLRDAERSVSASASGAASVERQAEVLERCLSMMRGNRSSTCVTYFVGDELRVVPFVARDGDEARRMLTSLRESLVGRKRPR